VHAMGACEHVVGLLVEKKGFFHGLNDIMRGSQL